MLSWSLVDSDKDGKKTSDSEKQVRVTIQGGDGKKAIFISRSNVTKNTTPCNIFFSNHVTSYVMISWPLVNSDNDEEKTGDLEKQERVIIQGKCGGKKGNIHFTFNIALG